MADVAAAVKDEVVFEYGVYGGDVNDVVMRGRLAATSSESVELRLNERCCCCWPMLLSASDESSVVGDDERVSDGGEANMPACGWTWAGEMEIGGINEEDDEEAVPVGWKAKVAS